VGYTELNGQYQRLRDELDAAYSRPVWNSSKIDRIADEIVQVELALASAEHQPPHTGPGSMDTGDSAAA
jgi:hypothetical protein